MNCARARILPLSLSLAVGVTAILAAGCGPPYAGGYDAAYPGYGGNGYGNGYGSVYAESVPPYIESYPHVWYNGGYNYLYNDNWYYPTNRGWMTFREEPYDLRQYRERAYVQQAPPAYRGPVYGAPPVYSAPPAYGGAPYGAPAYGSPPVYSAPPAYTAPPAYAPPAVRVR